MEAVAISRISVADQVAAILRSRILNGELTPGTALQEIATASSFGVSRNTVREATRILALEGLVKRSAHRGAAVAQLLLRDVREIYQMRHLLEVPAVLNANSHDTELLAGLRDALDGYEQSVAEADWVRAVKFDLQFHKLLIRFHRNERITSFYEKLIGELRMGMVLVDRRHDDPGRLAPVHRRIYELLRNGELSECASVLTQHLRDSEGRLAEIMEGNRARA